MVPVWKCVTVTVNFCLQGHPPWNWNDSAGSWSVQPDMSTAECLEILLEMGFTNKNLNVLLLQRYDNNITKVVAELLTSAGPHFTLQ
jgi:hypothetical protein